MEDPPENTNSTSNETAGPAQAKPAAESAQDKSESSSQGAGAASKTYRTQWPLIVVALGSLVTALIGFTFQLIIGESAIAWWHEAPIQPPYELHVKANETHGRIVVRNLTGRVFKNVGIQLEVSRGKLNHGIFAADPPNIVAASESRTMSTLETGPKIAPFVLRQHVERFDPGHTWFFYYAGNDVAEVTPEFTEGVDRADFLELKKPASQATTPESKEAQAIALHPWGWKDLVLEYKIYIASIAVIVCIITTITLFVRW